MSCLQDGESATVGVASEVTIMSSRMSLSTETCATNVSRYRYVTNVKTKTLPIEGTFGRINIF